MASSETPVSYTHLDVYKRQIYPSVEDIAQAIAKRDKAKIAPMGAYALNRLGLSTQMPDVYKRQVWGERAKDKSQYLSQLHTDYYNKVGHKYGLARGFSYDELRCV